VRATVRMVLNAAGLVAAAPFILWAQIGLRLFSTERQYVESAQALAVAPGYVGFVLRRAFYRCVLRECYWDLGIDFGSIVTHATARLGRNIYIGSYSLIGRCHMGSNVRIGSRVSILSGRHQHSFRDAGFGNFEESTQFREIEIGSDTWIGEASVVMADLGVGCGVGAGSVVVKPVPDGTIVVGNPARAVGTRQE
jgi:acetyltransferase-like isoleucine patch superfamily enzyme